MQERKVENRNNENPLVRKKEWKIECNERKKECK